jgi:GNAT superfamily N-acetyltransferase
MGWYKDLKLSRYFNLDVENDMDEFEEQSGMNADDANEQGYSAFQNTQINTRKPIREVVMPDDEDKVVGATAEDWTPITGEADKTIYEYSFDLSVIKDFQKKGIGRQLINNALKRYESEKQSYEDMDAYTRIKVWVVNAKLAEMLENEYGFDVEPVAFDNGEAVQWYGYKY